MPGVNGVHIDTADGKYKVLPKHPSTYRQDGPESSLNLKKVRKIKKGAKKR